MFVALVIQRVKRMRRIVLSYVACPAVRIFPHCLINGTIFGEKIIQRVLGILENLCLKYFSL